MSKLYFKYLGLETIELLEIKISLLLNLSNVFDFKFERAVKYSHDLNAKHVRSSYGRSLYGFQMIDLA